MGRPSKFTEPTKKQILEYLRLGASRQTAAHAAGVGKATLTRWVQEGEAATQGSAKRKFFEAVLEAESQGSIKALRIVQTEMENEPKLAWRYLERKEPGYAPPVAQPPRPMQSGPVVIALSLGSTQPVIEGEVVDEPDGLPSGA